MRLLRSLPALAALLVLSAAAPQAAGRGPGDLTCGASQTGSYGTLSLMTNIAPDGARGHVDHLWSADHGRLMLSMVWSAPAASDAAGDDMLSIAIRYIEPKGHHWARPEIRANGVRQPAVRGDSEPVSDTLPNALGIDIRMGLLRELARQGQVTVAAVGEGDVVLAETTIDPAAIAEPGRSLARAEAALRARLADPGKNCHPAITMPAFD